MAVLFRRDAPRQKIDLTAAGAVAGIRVQSGSSSGSRILSIEQIVQQRLQRLAGRQRHVLARVAFDAGLVGAGMREVGRDVELVCVNARYLLGAQQLDVGGVNQLVHLLLELGRLLLQLSDLLPQLRDLLVLVSRGIRLG